MASDTKALPRLSRLLLLGFFALLLACAPQFVEFPHPDGAIEFVNAQFSIDGGTPETVTLPHAWSSKHAYGPATARYVLDIKYPSSSEQQFLLIPAVRQNLTAELDGQSLDGNDARFWGNPSSGTTHLLRLPVAAPGSTGRLVLTLERNDGAVPGYLSRVYVVGEKAVAQNRWLRVLSNGGLRAIIHALHILIVIGIATVWATRRHDPVFCWLLLICGCSLVLGFPSVPISPPALAFIRPYLVLTLSTFGLMSVGLALAINGVPRPAWLKAAVPLLPLLLIGSVATGVLPPFTGAMISVLIVIGGHFTAAGLLARDALRAGEWGRTLLALTFFLIGWWGLRDVGIVLGVVNGGFLLGTYLRSPIIVAIMVLLMGRLAASLNELDNRNETLRLRLKEQEAELSILNDKERIRTVQAAREEERERLMLDLHDGLSGHLVSIIALAERDTGERQAIERAAREALNDLRLVINALDLGEGDLLLALAGFRERLTPQMRRLGVDLSWSMENLPEVSGVTPGNALSILRILQEAITNALKHGPASHIKVKGSAGNNGAAVIKVKNDGSKMAAFGKGSGLGNMQRRAQQLGGHVSLDETTEHAILTLVLPPRLGGS
jgi:signal transduction histidine kinase